MARRLVVLRSPSGSMAVVLLLAVAVVLSNVPSSALASSASSSSSLPSETTGSSGGGDEQEALAPPSSDDEDDKEQEQEMDPEKQKQKEKEKERQMAKEKAAAEEKVAQQELLKYAEEKRIVSPTNGTGWYKGIAREFVDAHNELRARYGVPPMKWDRKLARQARRWSNAMRKDCQLLHSGHEFGQSVFRSHDDWNATAREAVFWWGKEEAIYDKQREKCLDGKSFKECGHFALMVAKRSTKVGCARAECFKGGVFITCNYNASDLKDKDKDKMKNEQLTPSHPSII
ncbi:unnamed protein product [Miscanthus lutarioriparius]|uniref:SCP domain-containing protein n=1 Tax=Miscanthus lutarioriparius TaxID=422564 RepID=A0A811RMA9_9POAL|nr:unnamed protein product [Miscanthus lutarioriparius]